MLYHFKVDRMEFYHLNSVVDGFKCYSLPLGIRKGRLLLFFLDRKWHLWQSIRHNDHLICVSFEDKNYVPLSMRMDAHPF